MSRRPPHHSPFGLPPDIFSPLGLLAAVERVMNRGHAMNCACRECAAARDLIEAPAAFVDAASKANRAPPPEVVRREVVDGYVSGEVEDVKGASARPAKRSGEDR